MTLFRKRLFSEVINRVNGKVIELARRETPLEDASTPEGGGKQDFDANPSETANAGTILMVATCSPTDIKYPTD